MRDAGCRRRRVAALLLAAGIAPWPATPQGALAAAAEVASGRDGAGSPGGTRTVREDGGLRWVLTVQDGHALVEVDDARKVRIGSTTLRVDGESRKCDGGKTTVEPIRLGPDARAVAIHLGGWHAWIEPARSGKELAVIRSWSSCGKSATQVRLRKAMSQGRFEIGEYPAGKAPTAPHVWRYVQATGGYELRRQRNPGILWAEATSTLASEGDFDYPAAASIDLAPETAWAAASHGTPGTDLLGLELGRTRHLKGLRLSPGCGFNAANWAQNPRVRELRIRTNGSTENHTLPDTPFRAMSTVMLDHPVDTRTVQISVISTYPGSRFDNVCISELEIVADPLPAPAAPAGGPSLDRLFGIACGDRWPAITADLRSDPEANWAESPEGYSLFSADLEHLFEIRLVEGCAKKRARNAGSAPDGVDALCMLTAAQLIDRFGLPTAPQFDRNLSYPVAGGQLEIGFDPALQVEDLTLSCR